MFVFLCVTSAIGLVAIALVVWPIVREIIRSFRQAMKLCHVYARLSGKDKFPIRWIWKCFVSELLGSYYDTVTIGPYKLDRNPSKRITTSRY